MAFVFMDGFDHYTFSDITQKWNTLADSATVISMTSGRLGGGALKFNYGGGATSYIIKTSSLTTTFYAGFAIKMDAIGTGPSPFCFCTESGVTQMFMYISGSGNLGISKASGNIGESSGFPMSTGNWNFIEWMMTPSDSCPADSNIIRLNGVEILNIAAGTNTRTSAVNGLQGFGFGYNGLQVSVGLNYTLDDLWLLDSTGTPNTFLGPNLRVSFIEPNADGSNQDWSVNTGTHWEAVNTSDGDSTYIYSNTLSQVDTFDLKPIAGTDQAIKGVQTVLLARKDDAGIRMVKPVVRTGGVDYEGSTSSSLNTTYSYYLQSFPTNPDTSADWTIADINGLQVGAKMEA